MKAITSPAGIFESRTLAWTLAAAVWDLVRRPAFPKPLGLVEEPRRLMAAVFARWQEACSWSRWSLGPVEIKNLPLSDQTEDLKAIMAREVFAVTEPKFRKEVILKSLLVFM